MTSFESWYLFFFITQTAVITIGFIVAFRQLGTFINTNRLTIKLSERSNAMELIERYNEIEFMKYRLELRRNKESQKDVLQSAYIMNFLEEVAISVKHKQANEKLVKDFFATILRQWMEEDYVVNAMKYFRAKDRSVYENVLELYRSWEIDRQKSLKVNQVEELKA